MTGEKCPNCSRQNPDGDTKDWIYFVYMVDHVGFRAQHCRRCAWCMPAGLPDTPLTCTHPAEQQLYGDVERLVFCQQCKETYKR